MIEDIPMPEDFYEAGRELLGFAWETVVGLLRNLDEAAYFGVDTDEVSESYWDAAKRHLGTALSITQQGVEFVLKGKIAEVSPFLLISEHPSRWPSPYEGTPVKFSRFRTIDAQDLIRTHDTVAGLQLSADFVRRYTILRDKRNIIMHSVDKNLGVNILEVIDSILFMHGELFPDETWGQFCYEHIRRSVLIQLHGEDHLWSKLCHEISLTIQLLEPAQVMRYFRIDKNQRRYYCPKCYDEADHDAGDFDYKLAVLKPQSGVSTRLYCPVCNFTHSVARDHCDQDDCAGNVMAQAGWCLTCAG